MEKTVQELKTILRELIIEVGDMKEKLALLEKEWQEMGSKKESPEITGNLQMAGESYENLGRIYSEGYHVCPMAYGQVRTEDCLFCMAFMEKE